MNVRVLPFGVLKDWLGAGPRAVELPAGATVAGLLALLGQGRSVPLLAGIAVSVNAEFATPDTVLHDGDEVGLLPPVSGGSAGVGNTAGAGNSAQLSPPVLIALTRQPIDSAAIVASAKHGSDGAVIVFDGIVRNNTRSRPTLFLDYEAYEEMAARQMSQLAEQALARFAVRHVTLVHRLGRLLIGETSVLIVVASAHRAPAFDACRWLIDTLKSTVPIWKKETFADGANWAPGEPFPPQIAVNLAEAAYEE